MTIGVFNRADRQTERIVEICHISSQFLLALIITIGLSTTTFAQADRFLFSRTSNVPISINDLAVKYFRN